MKDTPARTAGHGMSRAEMAEAIMQGLMLPDAVKVTAMVAVQLMPDREVNRLGMLAEKIFGQAIECIERKDYDGLRVVLEQAGIATPFVDLVMARVRSPRHHGK